MMPATKYKSINRRPKACSWARDYNVIITLLRGLDNGPTLNHVPLSCSILVATMITRISPHLLTSINWWLSQREKNHTRDTQANRKG